jgi:glycolate oxidase
MARKSRITPNILTEFANSIGKDSVLTDFITLEKHSKDHSNKDAFLPEVVLKPSTTEQVAHILKICNTHRIPITVQGGLSGMSGAALPVLGGVVLSMARFDKILHIDKANFQVTTESGVITEHLQNVLKEEGLFYPPDPQGKGSSFIGGNINTNAGGPKCVKYGVTRDYVLNVEIVLPSGEIMWTASNTLKFSTGYNLTHLIIGSEGTLAVVTKIVLRLIPLPTASLLMLASFPEAEDACRAVAAVFQAGVVPSGLEYMEQAVVEYSAKFLGIAPPMHGHDAHLLIEVDGMKMETLQEDCEKIYTILQDFNVGEILFADSEDQKRELWTLRRNVSYGLRLAARIRLSEDTVVPRAALPAQLRGVREIGAQYAVKIVAHGHLGDGNMHVNILSDDTEDWYERAIQAKRAIFQLTKSLNGMLSAEHGVGYTQAAYLDVFFGKTHLALLKGIKKVFDPRKILNPKKFV